MFDPELLAGGNNIKFPIEVSSIKLGELSSNDNMENSPKNKKNKLLQKLNKNVKTNINSIHQEQNNLIFDFCKYFYLFYFFR